LFHEKNPTVSLVLKTEQQEVLWDKLIKDELDDAFIYDKYGLCLNIVFIFKLHIKTEPKIKIFIIYR
jgi:hypothetical protein